MLNMRPAGIQASILIKVSMSNADGTKAAGLVKSAETKPSMSRGFFAASSIHRKSAGLPGFRINRKAVFGEF
jgi:hypothetical protein